MSMDKIESLKETRLIRNMFLKLILPATIFGIICMFNPYTLIVLPVSFSGSCWNYFGKQDHYDYSFCQFNNINVTIYVLFRALELFLILLMMFKIRNVKEEMNIKNELMVIFGIILIFSFSYAIPLGIQPGNPIFQGNKISYEQVFFCLLLIKNYARLLTSVIFCY